MSVQPRVTVTPCLAHKIIRDLESIYRPCTYPIHRIGSIHKRSISIRARPSEVHTLVFHLASETKHYATVTPGRHDSMFKYNFSIQFNSLFTLGQHSQQQEV